MTATILAHDISALETCLDTPSTPAAEALAASLAGRLAAVSPADSRDARELAVRGLLVANHQFYRTGDVRRCGELLRSALALATDIDPALRINALLRCGEFELLLFDIGAALAHTAAAMDVAYATGLRVDEARAWTNYGLALDSAGLYRQADEHWARALDVLEGTDETRLRGNIWALRCPLGFRLVAGQEDAAAETCRQALAFALAAPVRYRDSMACTALCNWAALDIQCGRLGEAREHLDRAGSYFNLGVRPRWLIAALRAMAAVRARNEPGTRAALDALLEPERAPAIAYVIETISVLAATYADMGDALHAGETLARLSTERARALWAMLRSTGFAGTPVLSGSAAPPGAAALDAGADETTALLERLAVTAELRDDAAGKHCFRVGRLAMLLGRRAGLPEAQLASLELAARLHDIGKIVIPDGILLERGRLDATETHLMRTHTTIGADILSSGALPMLDSAREIARHHHEHWNGGGYPDGLAGDAIPLTARIAALADVYDALTHERPYKPAWSHDDAIDYIARMSGTHFDPRLAGLFQAMMTETRSDLAAFLHEAESAAADSSFVLAQTRVARALRE
jgi:HD-GYP domain-containing protein (c-di-GMP phosphodiesterase class II)